MFLKNVPVLQQNSLCFPCFGKGPNFLFSRVVATLTIAEVKIRPKHTKLNYYDRFLMVELNFNRN